MTIVETFLEMCILGCFLFLIFLLVRKFGRKIRKKKGGYTISGDQKWKEKISRYIRARLLAAKRKEEIDYTPIVHISEYGDVFLCIGTRGENSIEYTAEKEYRKYLKPEEKIGIFYPHGGRESGYLFDAHSPANFRINPSLEKTAKHSAQEFSTVFSALERDFTSKAILNISADQRRMVMLFFIAGIGIASAMWMGAILILFVF